MFCIISETTIHGGSTASSMVRHDVLPVVLLFCPKSGSIATLFPNRISYLCIGSHHGMERSLKRGLPRSPLAEETVEVRICN